MSSKKSFRNKYVYDYDEEVVNKKKGPSNRRRPIRNWTKIVEEHLDDIEVIEDFYEDLG